MPGPFVPALSLSTSNALTVSVDTLVIGVRAGAATEFDAALTAVGFAAKPLSTALVPGGSDAKVSAVVAVRLPKRPSRDDLRKAAAVGVRAAKGKKVAVAFDVTDAADVAAVTEGALLGGYRFDTFKAPSKDAQLSSVVVLSSAARQPAVKDAVESARIVSAAVAQSRDWANTPPGDLRPPGLADAIKATAATGVRVTIWDETRLAKEGCGGLTGVGRGSEAGPRLVRLDYNPRGAKKHLALVGKGITFDSGGLSIKPGASMATMKLDMSGAASVAAAVSAIATLKLPIRVTGFACLAENMPSGSATRPGDVLTIRNGATVEVLNTDAEGRLVLADGLSLAVEAKPDAIVDVATLTGACMVALGTRTCGVFGTDGMAESVIDASIEAGESMWHLPLTDEMPEIVHSSKVADLAQHNPKPYGGAIYAATFLKEFTGDLPWAHLDIAGPSFNEGAPYGENPSGGTGVAVRTLVQLARDMTGKH